MNLDVNGKGRKVSVIGAGFSGLTSAYYLKRAGFDVEVFESSERSGGLIQTRRENEGLVETAANAILNSPLVEELFTTVGVPLAPTLRSSRRRYIFRSGRMRRWPLGLISSFRVFLFILKFLIWRRAVAPAFGETINLWAERVVGTEARDYLINTGLQGIYAGDPSRLSASLILGRFFRPRKPVQIPVENRVRPKRRSNWRERLRQRRKLKGPKGSVSAPEGLGQLLSALERYLRAQGVQFHFRSIEAGESAETTTTMPTTPVVIATPPHAAASILTNFASEVDERAALLSRIEMSPVTTTTAFFEQTDPASEGFGVLFPAVEKKRMLGVLKNNLIFNGRVTRRSYSETWIQGGALQPELINLSDEQIRQSIRDERADVFHLRETERASYLTRWPRGIPHYTCELEAMLPTLERAQNNVFLIGNYLGDLGLGKILERASRLPDQMISRGVWK